MKIVLSVLIAAGLGASGAAWAYPGGTPAYQTDAAPFCASCHSSRSVGALAGAPGGRAEKELAENKHLALIRAGEADYSALEPAQREELARQIAALDAASTVAVDAPEAVAPGATFQVTVAVTGGAGPAVGVALVDADHRWLARPAPSTGWFVAAPPVVTGQDLQGQVEWLSRRPEAAGRNLAYVNVTGISSDASKKEWAKAKVVYTLRAPAVPGTYPLAAAFWYGTEKGSPLGYTTDPIRGKMVRGGFGGHSGRVLFSPVLQIKVE
jgi:hypothetical protein